MKLADKKYDVFSIPIFSIWVDDGFNCRSTFTDESIRELAESIEQDGLLFPVDVQPIEEVEDAPAGFQWRLLCGFRRMSAARMLGWDTIPARVRTDLTERQATLMNLTENLERKDLNIYEEAVAIDRLFPVYRTSGSIAKELKRPFDWVQVRRKLLGMPEWIRKAAASGRLSSSEVRFIVSSSNPEEKTREILKSNKKNRVRDVTRDIKRPRTKKEIQSLITKLLQEGFNPQILRLLGWAIGEVDTEGLNESLSWLRARRGWLK